MVCAIREGSKSIHSTKKRHNNSSYSANMITFAHHKQPNAMKLYPLLFGGIGTTEVILIVLVILLLFGAKRIPELMKSMGKGVKNFKEGMKEVEKEINATDDSAKDSEPESK